VSVCQCVEASLINVNGACTPRVTGCNKPTSLNFNPNANVNDGTCTVVQAPVSPTSTSTASSSDGTVTVTVPAGAVTTDTVVVVQDATGGSGSASTPGAGADTSFSFPTGFVPVSTVNQITLQSGQTMLGSPVTIQMDFDCSKVQNVDNTALQFSSNGMDWELTTSTSLDTNNCVATGSVGHFSYIVVLEDRNAPAPKTTAKSSGSNSSAGAIAGGVIGALAAVALLAAFIHYRRAHKHRSNSGLNKELM